MHRSACTRVNYSSKWREESRQYPPTVSMYLNESLAFHYCTLPTTGIILITACMRGWIMPLWNVPFVSPEWKVSLPVFSPLSSYTKQCEQESVGIIFLWYSSCVAMRVWLRGKWNTHQSRFMDQRCPRHSASTAHCRCGVLEHRRGRCRRLKCALS